MEEIELLTERTPYRYSLPPELCTEIHILIFGTMGKLLLYWDPAPAGSSREFDFDAATRIAQKLYQSISDLVGKYLVENNITEQPQALLDKG